MCAKREEKEKRRRKRILGTYKELKKQEKGSVIWEMRSLILT
jgi:hypothetical protein